MSVGRLTMSAKPPEPAAMYHGSTGGSGPSGGPGAGGGLLHAFPSRPLTTDAIYNPSAIYAAAAAAQAYIPFGASDSSAFYPALVTVSHRLNLAVKRASSRNFIPIGRLAHSSVSGTL